MTAGQSQFASQCDTREDRRHRVHFLIKQGNASDLGSMHLLFAFIAGRLFRYRALVEAS